MADNSKPLILRTNEKPTFFNKEAAIGFLADPLSIFGVTLGGIIGKERMEKEQVFGKVVGKPSMANKSAILGGLIGLTSGLIISITAAANKFMTTVAEPTLLQASLVAAESLIPPLIVGVAAFTIASAAIGTLIGGYSGKKTQEKEYAQALAQQREHEQQRAIEPSVNKSAGHEYNHEVKINHAATIEAERAKAKEQHRHV